MRTADALRYAAIAAAAVLMLGLSGCSKHHRAEDAAGGGERVAAESLAPADAGAAVFRGGRGTGGGGHAVMGRGGAGRGPGGPGRGLRLSPVRLSAGEVQALEIKTAAVELRPMDTDLKITGKIYAHQFRQAIVSYPFPARIARIHVRPGERVRAGQEVVTLQSEAVGEAKSEYFKAVADHELARSSHDREKRLFDRGAGAGKNLQSAEAQLKVADADLEAAEKKLHILGFTEDQVRAAAENHEINPFITLFAPIAGKVAANTAVLGGMVDQATEILTILDPSVLCADGAVYERDLARIRRGQTIEVTVPAYPVAVFTGKVQYIGDVLDEATRTVTVRAEVANPDEKLKPGMFADLRIVLDRVERAVVVPEQALIDDGGTTLVFVRRGDEFVPRVVRTGARLNGFIMVAEGLAEGDEIVTDGGFQLKSKLYDEILKRAGIH